MSTAVSFEDAGIRFGSRWVWRNASFAIPPGAFVAVVGPNGAGKSTLLKAILGLLPPTEGRVLVDGVPPRRGNPRIGAMPQLRPVDPDLAVRGRDVVRCGVDGMRLGLPRPGRLERERRRRVDAALAEVGAAAYADRRLGSLSGGEAQRLFLAQALVGDPELLLLDEPLANLDLKSRSSILALVGAVVRRRRIAVVLIAHDVNGMLPYLDQVVYVANGGVASGTPDEVISSATLSAVYGAPVEVIRDSLGRRFVVGPETSA